MMEFEKINIINAIVASMLCISLLAAIFYQQEQLAMSIASGLLGFIGGTTAAHINKNMEGNKK